MRLRLKGFFRRIVAHFASQSKQMWYAVGGVVLIAVIIVAVVLVRGATAAEFSISGLDTANAQEDSSETNDADSVIENATSIEDESDISTDETAEANQADDEETLLAVYVSGEVAQPGVYYVKEGSRVVDCVELAGGLLEDANTNAINLAASVTDGEHVIIPAIGDDTYTTSSTSSSSSGLVNINTATVTELTALDGIGEVLAGRIVTYREKIGGFTSLEQLKNVSGIGDSRYEAIKDDICL